ncbi:hypothetical protein M2137_000675 [Parabacteroides sp. PFB2-10]|uniref:hypothetical protein n=1 Tax=Parabacteroides sp. PFB2-10 TaxID=1742405 RepID=UPI002474C525|nr:hypothetical protein [Parabacteroides sp. PFB2-10]MDH6311916.1 hypothetical protein [Parabacteroides sp. PFB2-10]
MKKQLNVTKWIWAVSVLFLLACTEKASEKIDRYALVERNNPHVTEFEELSSLSVGNGNFAVTVDATGLQTFPELYAAGVPLGTQAQWGWHSFPNTEKLTHEETLKNYNFRGWEEPYAVQFNDPGRPQDAANYYRINPHRLHLGYIGLELTDENGQKLKVDAIQSINQELNLWDGRIDSRFSIGNDSASVRTAVDPVKDRLAAEVNSAMISKGTMQLNLRFPYPTGQHSDDASDWNSPQKHKTEIVSQDESSFVLKRTLDETVYYLTVTYSGKATVIEKEAHYFVITPEADNFHIACEFTDQSPANKVSMVEETFTASAAYWQDFWQRGGAIDFSRCTDERAPELERRILLSQYIMAIQSAGMYPPQETGLTYNSWYGKFHLEMHWWHAVHFALWNRADLLERSMDWYTQAYPVAKSIAERQGFKGARWMKMTDPSATEAPSKVGSFLIWQQPHFIYMAELIYRNNPSQEVIDKYAFLVNETAEFMASFATYDELEGRYILKGIIPAQETLRASETINPPFELSYWHYAMSVAQQWREREGKKRKPQWDELIDKLSPLAYQDGLYLASEDAVDTYIDIRFTSDHPAILGALGILPQCKLVRPDYMKNTLNWIWDNWNWGKTWGWDYPMTAMSAARLGDTEKAVGALLMEKRTNTYLVNGHNYQDSRLRIYLPGNGGLLTAAAMMCAGWDGNTVKTPGFPKDGTWNVVWEDLQPMP